MPELKRLRTLLLGLVVILITFTIFIALPARLPAFESLGCDKVMWACTLRGIPPAKYDTWFWDNPEQPEYEAWLDTCDLTVGYERMMAGILKTSTDPGILKVEVDPENENVVIFSGYLQYGTFPEPVMGATEQEMKCPYPEMVGVRARYKVSIAYRKTYLNTSTVEETEVTTDDSGFFTVSIKIDPNTRSWRFTASTGIDTVVPKSEKRPIETYFGTSITYSMHNLVSGSFPEIEEKSRLRFIIIALVLLIAGLFFLYRRYRHRYVPGYEEFLSAAEEKVTARRFREKEPETGGDTDRIKISLPDIEEHLPGVWEVNKLLSINILLTDAHDEPVPGQMCVINPGEGEVLSETSDRDGGIYVSHVFLSTGEYIIYAGYTDEETGKELSSWRKIRIVDYREEMVRLFNEMLETLNIMDITIDPEMTAREVETLILDRLEGVSREAVRRVVTGFEEANYSTHPVGRESYTAMYPAVMEVLDYGG
jgi:hypothetical protein